SDNLNPRLQVVLPTGQSFTIPPTADFLVPSIQRLAIQGADFPSTSTTPGVSFVYNPQLGMFERSPSLGPVFVERAGTLGANHFSVGLSYLYANLDQIDGGGFGTYGLNRTFVPGFATVSAFEMQKFNLKYSIWNLSGTYGITDRWDLNVFLPLIDTRLSAREHLTLRTRTCDETCLETAGQSGLGPLVATGEATLSVSGSH